MSVPQKVDVGLDYVSAVCLQVPVHTEEAPLGDLAMYLLDLLYSLTFSDVFYLDFRSEKDLLIYISKWI